MQEKAILYKGIKIYTKEYKGEKPAIVLLHGFPDNHHLYDELIPYLNEHRIIVFDFIGWGESDKPPEYNNTASAWLEELNFVIDHFQIEKFILVAHDASGPPAIDWALTNPNKLEDLILLNTYYCKMKKLRPPEAIFLFSTPLIRNFARFGSRLFNNFIFKQMYLWQVGRFFSNPDTMKKYVPVLYKQFEGNSGTQNAFFNLNHDLLGTMKKRSKKNDLMKAYPKKVKIIFGENDKYLNKHVAKQFHEIFPNSELHLIKDARHFVQMDKPEEVANLILA